MRLRAYLPRSRPIRTMRRASLLVLAVAVTGCGATGKPVPVSIQAPPQSARLGWQEPFPAEQPALVFGVSSFTVTATGWTADISVENRSDVGWKVGGSRGKAGLVFGVMLFPTGSLDDLERRSRSGDLPGIREAITYRPAPPKVIEPGATWRGTIAAPGALAGGLWVRLSFGAFTSVGKPPPGTGTGADVIWFTDHAHQLEQTPGTPA